MAANTTTSQTLSAQVLLDASSHALASLKSAAPRNHPFSTALFYACVALLAVPFAPVLLLMWAAKAIDCPPAEAPASVGGNELVRFEDADAAVAPLLFWC